MQALSRSSGYSRSLVNRSEGRQRVTCRAAGVKQACRVSVDVSPSEAAVGERLCQLVADSARGAIAKDGRFVMAVPGGSVLKMLSGLKSFSDVDWAKVHVWYVNHKVLSHSDAASTHKKALDGFVKAVGIPHANVAAPLEPAEGQELAAAAAAAAADYESRLKHAALALGLQTAGGFPRLDLMVLGMGADGHVGSLYPHKPTLEETDAWVLPFQKSTDAASITLSLPVMSAGRDVVICLTGEKKATAVKLAIEGAPAPGELPGAMVAPAADAQLTWLLDSAAAAQLGS